MKIRMIFHGRELLICKKSLKISFFVCNMLRGHTGTSSIILTSFGAGNDKLCQVYVKPPHKTEFQYQVQLIKVTLNAIKEEIVLGVQRAQ